MSDIAHHIPEPILAAYAAGSLPRVFEVVVATHISMCDSCRGALAAHEALGGTVLEGLAEAPVSDTLLAGVMDRLDHAQPDAAPAPKREGIYPGPVMTALKSRPPRWKRWVVPARPTELAATLLLLCDHLSPRVVQHASKLEQHPDQRVNTAASYLLEQVGA